MSRSHRIAVTVSDDLLAAIDAQAFETDQTRAGLMRQFITDELRRLGQFAPKAPPTHQLGLGNPRYRPGVRP